MGVEVSRKSGGGPLGWMSRKSGEHFSKSKRISESKRFSENKRFSEGKRFAESKRFAEGKPLQKASAFQKASPSAFAEGKRLCNRPGPIEWVEWGTGTSLGLISKAFSGR